MNSPVQIFGSETKDTLFAHFQPLALRAKDGKVFKLTEPNQERDIVGSILEMEGMKMHVTQVLLLFINSNRREWRTLSNFLNYLRLQVEFRNHM